MKARRGKRLVWRGLLGTLGCLALAFIFYQSSRVGNSSEQFSQAATSLLNEWITLLPFGEYLLSEGLVRKLAHFAEYWLLGASWTGFFLTFPQLRKKCGILMVLGGGIAAASLDEWIQSHTPERSGQFSDVLLDCFGIGVGIAAAIGLYVLIKRRSNRTG